MFWDPAASPSILPAIALPGGAPLERGVIHLSASHCRMVTLLLPDGAQHLLFQDAGRTLQLAVAGGSLLGPMRLVTDAVLDRESRRARLAALASLSHLRESGRLPVRYFPPEPRGRRLRVVLRALDGRLTGASHREIATALFGPLRVERDWADPRDHLRDVVRRAVGRGRRLMQGGYLQFLRCLVILAIAADIG